jgi:cleavage stimulation factor subunit 1
VIATGSADTSIKLLDVQKMVNYSQSKNEGGDDFQGARPVLRTLYDHTQAINDIDFHPTLPLLASASRDNTIKFYDYHSSMKKSFKYLQVRKISGGSREGFLSLSLLNRYYRQICTKFRYEIV